MSLEEAGIVEESDPSLVPIFKFPDATDVDNELEVWNMSFEP